MTNFDITKQIFFCLLTAGIGYLVAFKKQKAEIGKIAADTEHTEVTTIKEVADLWKATALEFKKEVAELRVIVDELKKENMALKKEINNLKVSYK